MDFVVKLQKTMTGRKIKLAYEGEINQSLTKAFAGVTEKKLEDNKEDANITKKVYHVMVECLQNICKHSDDEKEVPTLPEFGLSGNGIFLVGEDEFNYFITTGNAVNKEKAEKMREVLDSINSLNKDEIKAAYIKQMKEGRLSDKGGAGLGFLDMAKKTGNKLIYHLEPLNDDKYLFILKTTVSKAN